MPGVPAKGTTRKNKGDARAQPPRGRHGCRGLAAGLPGIDAPAGQVGKDRFEKERDRQSQDRPLDRAARSSGPASTARQPREASSLCSMRKARNFSPAQFTASHQDGKVMSAR